MRRPVPSSHGRNQVPDVSESSPDCLLEPMSGTRYRTGSKEACSHYPADGHGDPRVDLGRLDEGVDLEVLAQLDVHQPGRGAVVDGRHAVARERGRVAE